MYHLDFLASRFSAFAISPGDLITCFSVFLHPGQNLRDFLEVPPTPTIYEREWPAVNWASCASRPSTLRLSHTPKGTATQCLQRINRLRCAELGG